jgi:hypothetical protein
MSLDLDNFNVYEVAFHRSLANAAVAADWEEQLRRVHNLGGKKIRIDKLLGNIGKFAATGNVNAIVNSSIIGTQKIKVGGDFNQTLMNANIGYQKIVKKINKEIIRVVQEIETTGTVTKEQTKEILSEVNTLNNFMIQTQTNREKLLFLSHKILVLVHYEDTGYSNVYGFNGYDQKMLTQVQGFFKELFFYYDKLDEATKIVRDNVNITNEEKIIRYRNIENSKDFQNSVGAYDLHSLYSDNRVIKKDKMLRAGKTPLVDVKRVFNEIFMLGTDQLEVFGNENGVIIFIDRNELSKTEPLVVDNFPYSEMKSMIKKSNVYPEMYISLHTKPVSRNQLFLSSDEYTTSIGEEEEEEYEGEEEGDDSDEWGEYLPFPRREPKKNALFGNSNFSAEYEEAEHLNPRLTHSQDYALKQPFKKKIAQKFLENEENEYAENLIFDSNEEDNINV